MKKTILPALCGLAIFMASCTHKVYDSSKNAVAFPGMTVTRSDYKLSKDVSAEVEVKEWSTLGLGFIRRSYGGLIKSRPKATGEEKNKVRQGKVSNYSGMSAGHEIALYRLLEANPGFDYLTNIRLQKEYTKKWKVFFTTYQTTYKITAKGITLNTEK